MEKAHISSAKKAISNNERWSKKKKSPLSEILSSLSLAAFKQGLNDIHYCEVQMELTYYPGYWAKSVVSKCLYSVQLHHPDA